MKWQSLTIGVVLVLLAACSSSLNGHVYVDSNVNGQVDAGEKGVANIHYTVTVDGQQLTDGYTLKDGSYSVPIKSTGKVCVTIDKNSLQGVVSKGGKKPSLSLSPIVALPASVVADTYSQTPQKSVSVAKDVTPAPTPTPPPADTYAKPQQPAAGTMTISDQSGCVQMDVGNQDMDVPIKVDYQASFDAILEQPEVTVAPCDTFDWKWAWASACTPVGVAIPDAFVPMDTEVGMSGDASVSPMLDLSIGVTPDNTSPPTNLTQDALSTRIVHMQVKCGLTGDKQTYILQPQMICPDGKSYTPKSLKVTVNTKPAVTVQPNLVNGTPGLDDYGKTFEADFTVTNNNAQKYNAAILTITSTSALELKAQPPNGMTCNNLGQNLACTFNLDKQGTPGGVVLLKLNFTLPSKIGGTEILSYTLSSSLTLPNQSTAITGSDIKFSLSPN